MALRKGSKPFSITHPHLMEEWDFENNGDIRPEDYSHGSNKRFFWTCKGCGYGWVTTLNNRCRKVSPSNCPVCSEEKRKKSFMKRLIKKVGSLAETHPHLLEGWDHDRNEVKPTEITYGSKMLVWWKCKDKKCRYGWLARPNNRTGDNAEGCPACNSKAVTERNNLAVKFPEIAAEWHPTKNGGLNPHMVLPASHKKVFWKCSLCGRSWKTSIDCRTYSNTVWCPKCMREVSAEARLKTNLLKTGCLSKTHPHLMDEWDFEKNGSFRPENLTFGSHKKAWWGCLSCGCSWKGVVKNRTKDKDPSGCPCCVNNAISKKSQRWLDAFGILEKYREYRFVGLGGKIGIIVDGFDPKTKTVYEFLGDYWHGNPKVYKRKEINPTNKKSFGKLYKEWLERKSLLEENGYKVVYIWESDFIEE